MKTVTLVIPAYNEENRIEDFLKTVLDFKKKKHYLKEVLVINDGSTDRTLDILKKYKDIKVISHDKNKGKGAAIRTGLLAAKSDYVVFTDADGSVPIHELPKMTEVLDKYPMAVGVRNSKESRIIGPRPLKRIFVGKMFNLIVNVLFWIGVFDTLCGFKGFRREIAKEIVSEMKSNGWIFDVEMFIIAKKKGIKFGKVPVNWTHKEDSKMRLGMTNVKMLLELLELRLRA